MCSSAPHAQQPALTVDLQKEKGALLAVTQRWWGSAPQEISLSLEAPWRRRLKSELELEFVSGYLKKQTALEEIRVWNSTEKKKSRNWFCHDDVSSQSKLASSMTDQIWCSVHNQNLFRSLRALNSTQDVTLLQNAFWKRKKRGGKKYHCCSHPPTPFFLLIHNPIFPAQSCPRRNNMGPTTAVVSISSYTIHLGEF